MGKRPLLLLLAAAARIITYYAALIPGLENTWRQLAAAIAVAIMLAGCLQLFAGKPKAGFPLTRLAPALGLFACRWAPSGHAAYSLH
jgi:hypothetical protein